MCSAGKLNWKKIISSNKLVLVSISEHHRRKGIKDFDLPELEPDPCDALGWGRNCLVDFNAGKIRLVSFDWSNNSGTFNAEMDGFVLKKKSYFNMLGLTFSSKLEGSHIIGSFHGSSSKGVKS